LNQSLARERTALVLYVVLLVLPAVVLGVLLSQRLWRDHQVELKAVPDRCSDAARRLAEAVANRLEARLDEEGARPFFHYQEEFLDPDTTIGVALKPTPLVNEPRPGGVLAWYAYDDYDPHGFDAAKYFYGANPSLDEAEMGPIVRRDPGDSERKLRMLQEYQVLGTDVEGECEVHTYTYRVLGVNLHLNLQRGGVAQCERISREAAEYANALAEVRVTPLQMRRITDAAGEFRLVAERLVYLTPEPLRTGAPECIQEITRTGYQAYQGLVLDPHWLFEELPHEVARQVLDSSQSLSTADPSGSGSNAAAVGVEQRDVTVRSANLFDIVPSNYRLDPAAGLGELFITTDRTAMRQRFRGQIGWLAGVAALLALSMFVGVRLLVGRIQASREESLRTRNFVAAVTHELRTPVAAVKLYGEMLADGWIQDEAKRQDYLDRIVRETDRLSALIDRVLLRRKLEEQRPSPTAGDLNREVEAQRAELELVGGEFRHDVVFELAPNLPPVTLVPEGVHVVVTNLVENARKYAPARSGEPIVVRTRRDSKAGVVLEVLDRGPGVPDAERRRIFEAFYRPGDERTRSTTGTGLGLHLVALQVRAMGGKVEVLPRDGGGSVFRCTLRTA